METEQPTVQEKTNGEMTLEEVNALRESLLKANSEKCLAELNELLEKYQMRLVSQLAYSDGKIIQDQIILMPK